MRSGLRRLVLACVVAAAALVLPTTTASTTGVASGVARLGADNADARERLAPTTALAPGTAERAATLALRMVGTPYRYGGESPGGFDCSGLIRWAYGRVGVDVPHNSHALYSVGRVVPRSQLATGDVLFFSGLGHVGLYLGGGLMVHAPYSGKHVELVRLDETNYGRRLIGARRVSE
jgi:cell wall-associated NlpC family hydrolase